MPLQQKPDELQTQCDCLNFVASRQIRGRVPLLKAGDANRTAKRIAARIRSADFDGNIVTAAVRPSRSQLSNRDGCFGGHSGLTLRRSELACKGAWLNLVLAGAERPELYMEVCRRAALRIRMLVTLRATGWVSWASGPQVPSPVTGSVVHSNNSNWCIRLRPKAPRRPIGSPREFSVFSVPFAVTACRHTLCFRKPES